MEDQIPDAFYRAYEYLIRKTLEREGVVAEGLRIIRVEPTEEKDNVQEAV